MPTTETNVIEKIKVNRKLKKPNSWTVIFHNDDVTPMEYVMSLLMTIFEHSASKAEQTTLEIHNSGEAVVGVFGHEIALQKKQECEEMNLTHDQNLKVSVREDK